MKDCRPVRNSCLNTIRSGLASARSYGIIRSSESSAWVRQEHRFGSHTLPQSQPELNESSTPVTPSCSLYELINSKSFTNSSSSLSSLSSAIVTRGPSSVESFLLSAFRSSSPRRWLVEDLLVNIGVTLGASNDASCRFNPRLGGRETVELVSALESITITSGCCLLCFRSLG